MFPFTFVFQRKFAEAGNSNCTHGTQHFCEEWTTNLVNKLRNEFFSRRRRNVFRREIFCVLFSENNLVVICFSGNFFFCSVCSCRTHERTNETTKKRNVPRLRSRSESLFLQPDEVLVASSPVCRVVFSSHSCSVCANEGHCLLLGTMARLQTVATVATRPASAWVNRRVWMNGAC